MDRTSRSQQPFLPINILSQLPSIGGSIGNGRQEDAHEFMRFAIDMMQSVCLDEHGGGRLIHPKSLETILIQHIFGGQLRSQVLCTQCNQVSTQYENMMDLTVEIQGDATSLEECLDLFTAEERLHGENLYKCDRCNDYVRALKRITIHQAPNILTIALKRFQSGRFGKINKKICFPKCLDLSPFMSEERDGTNKYKLYAIVVHVDMLNASFCGHYICYTKGFGGDWDRIDDCKVTRMDMDEVLSQGAYMLLYRRISALPKCLKTYDPAMHQQQQEDNMSNKEEHNCLIRLSNSLNSLESSSSGLNKKQEVVHANIDSRVKHDPVACLEDSHSFIPVSSPLVSREVMRNGDDASVSLVAADTNRVFPFPICSATESSDMADVHGTSVLCVNVSGDIPREDSATAHLCEESNGELEEHRSEEETTKNGGATLLNQETLCEMSYSVNSSCADSFHHRNGEKNVAEKNRLNLGRLNSESAFGDMELASVEFNLSINCLGGAGDDMIICEDPVNTCADMQLENLCVHDSDTCVSNGHVELSDRS